MKWTAATFFLFATLATTIASAQGLLDTSRADGLADACKSYVNSLYGSALYPSHASSETEIAITSGYCSGYISGFISGASMVAPRGGKPLFCVPKDVTIEEYAKVFIKNVDEHPNVGHEGSLVVFVATLVKNWPCPA